MSYANRKEMSSNRVAAIIIVALIHIALGYALVTGLAYNVIKKAAEDLKTFDVEEEPPPPPEEPPPPPEQNTPPPPQIVAPPSIVRIESPAPAITTTPVIQQPVITPTARPAPTTKSCPGGTTVAVSQTCPPVVSQAARAKGNLPSLFSTDDYPQSAIRNEEQGTTAVRLTIGTDGRVAECSVTSSSGSGALDAATCNIIKRRARYTPARDQTGNPVAGTDSTRIRWVLPEE